MDRRQLDRRLRRARAAHARWQAALTGAAQAGAPEERLLRLVRAPADDVASLLSEVTQTPAMAATPPARAALAAHAALRFEASRIAGLIERNQTARLRAEIMGPGLQRPAHALGRALSDLRIAAVPSHA
ncbi:hypothetical protein ROJ8625_02258 [Roseivivax jejudonensis]|uniref:Uncharacterized protein n=1 Tax=Roseivivax jejudonensis TaxID=1529041 RepID=A0A1X6ZBK4_9RHOB|nr:hypothetical protein [Roseivivax jejudonensis]SLN46679.1 hypothetical protein ROJ8625_02258 [Roseivivax jejudonensis]